MSELGKSPVFFDPSHRRWKWFKRILALLLVMGMIIISAVALSIVTVSTLVSSGSLLPQAFIHAGPEIAHPSDLFNGSPQQQLQQMVATLNNYVPSPTSQTTPLATLVPANPLPKQETPTPLQPHSSPLLTTTSTRLFQASTATPIPSWCNFDC